jgi:hypothetical protein
MASGLAVVAFYYAAAHAHLESWSNGVKVPLGDGDAFVAAALAAAEDPIRLAQMGRAARETALGMGWGQVLAVFEGHLREVVRRRGQGTAGTAAALS